MMRNKKKRGFTLVELLIVTAIIAILSGAAYIGIRGALSRAMNERVTDDLSAIVNALEQFKQKSGVYPLPILGEDKNVLCFGEDLSYAHGSATDCSSALFMQAQIDNSLLTKMYLQEVPTDPRTGSRYAYGVTSDGKYYQVAGNFEESDGTWIARTAGNVNDYPFLTSLIRSWNGPDFVVDGEGWLPYSPDHRAITATLTDIIGTVEVDGNNVSDGTVVKPGSTVMADTGASVTLYFSDGSITYLDGTADPAGASLRILPSTTVDQNDKDGIITKIRIKIFSGKIWNKVVRLASESEFNVETTAAIAGVRGTEFGITAKNDPAYPELIVLSGTVVARHISDNEGMAAGTDGISFSSADTAFDDKKATGDGSTFKQFTLPSDPNAPLTSPGNAVNPAIQDEIMRKYYSNTPGLSPADTPYIVKAKSIGDGKTYTLFVAFNGFEDDGSKQIDGFEIYGESQTGSELRTLKTDAQGHPLMIVENAVFNPAEKAYTFDINYTTQPGNPLFNPDTSEMERIILRAFRYHYGKIVYSRLSWPLIGFVPDANTAFTYEYDNSQIYQEFFGVAQGQGGGTAPQITTFPSTVFLLGEGAFASDIPCNWSIEGGSAHGAFEGNYMNTAQVLYLGLDPSMTVDQKIANVSDRFKTSDLSSTTIRCSHPNDPSLFSEKDFVTSYEDYSFASGPNLSGYHYSWTAKGSTNWSTAKSLCEGLDEGGHHDWHLPEVGDTLKGYDRLAGTLGDNLTNPAEGIFWCGTFSGGQCSKMPTGVASIWLHEEQNASNAYIGYGANLADLGTGLSKPTSESWLGFRCVR